MFLAVEEEAPYLSPLRVQMQKQQSWRFLQVDAYRYLSESVLPEVWLMTQPTAAQLRSAWQTKLTNY